MNKAIRGPVINGDGSGQQLASIGNTSEARESAGAGEAAAVANPAAAGLAAAVASATADARAAAATRKQTPTPAAPVQPAFERPVDDPAVARDENHCKGGQYHIVEGKRVRVEPDTKA
jgi:hypothetical protein